MTVTLRCVIALLALNLVIVAPLLRIEYTERMGSIEAAFIAISHQWMKHGIDFRWWPLWYSGIPGQNTYPPLLHLLVAWAGSLAGISAALAHHVVTAAAYALGPVTVFWLARILGGHWIPAFAAGLLYSVLSPSAWLIPAVRADLGGIWRARRLETLVVYGEGPHLLALLSIPVAIVLLHLAITRHKTPSTRWLLPLAGLALAAVVLTNWLGAWGLAAAALCYLFTRPWKDWFIAGAIAVYAYALASPWIPPTTLHAIRANAQLIGGDFRFSGTQFAQLVALIVAAGAVSFVLRRFGPCLRFASAYFVLIGGITLLAEWFQIYVLPQPHRYHVQMEIAICLLLGVIVPRKPWAVAALAVLCVYPAIRVFQYSRELLRPIDITQTSEYKVARWFGANLPDRRVFTAGSTSYWLNSFVDTPQFGGGFDQGITIEALHGIQFQIYSGMGAEGREGKVALDYLRTFGVHAIAVAGPGSTEVYKPIAHPKKFDGLLEELWRDGGDVVYRVPQRSASLARAVPKDKLPAKPTGYFNDSTFLAPYLSAIDDPAMPDVSWRWLDRDRAVVEGTLSPGAAVSIQMAYHPGWRATVEGRAVPVHADGIGLTVIEPDCNGPCRIELAYRREIPMSVFWIALMAGIVFALSAFAPRSTGRPRLSDHTS